MIAYIIRNSANSKVYVGISTKPKARLLWHWNAADRGVPLPLYKAMNKHGKENFTFETVACARTWEDLCEVEKALISQYNSYGSSGYNSTAGGDGTLGTKRSDEFRAGRRQAMLGNKIGKHDDPAANEKRAAARRGKPRPSEVIAKTAAAHRGMKRSAECRAKMSAAKKGRKLTPEHSAKLAKTLTNPEVRARSLATRRAMAAAKDIAQGQTEMSL